MCGHSPAKIGREVFVRPADFPGNKQRKHGTGFPKGIASINYPKPSFADLNACQRVANAKRSSSVKDNIPPISISDGCNGIPIRARHKGHICIFIIIYKIRWQVNQSC